MFAPCVFLAGRHPARTEEVTTRTVTVSYGGECEVCGLSLSFTEQKPIPGVSS
jgi:hypothetical protein